MEKKVTIKNNEINSVIQQLEAIKKHTERGIEYWTAREFQDILGYTEWKGFADVIDRAKTACIESGEDVGNHFGETTKMVSIGSGAFRPIPDIFLTRYACYLIAMNGLSSRPEIAMAQTYFAIQTRKQELTEMENVKLSRLELRNKAKDLNNQLGKAAQDSGVENFGKFHNSGYRGLYDGRGVTEIKKDKSIPTKDHILDRMGNAELGMNIFRITQAEEQLKIEGVIGETEANRIHNKIGQNVRKAVKDIGGIMPEDLPAEPHIKEIEKEMKAKELKGKKNN